MEIQTYEQLKIEKSNKKAEDMNKKKLFLLILRTIISLLGI